MDNSPEIASGLRSDLTEFIEARLSRMGHDIDPPLQLPTAVDFFLIVAVEDAVDSESDTYYSLISSGCSHYRKVGLISCAKRMLLRDDPDDD